MWLDYKLVTVSVLLPHLFSSATAVSAGAIVSFFFGGGMVRLPADGWWFAISLAVYVLVGDLYRFWKRVTVAGDFGDAASGPGVRERVRTSSAPHMHAAHVITVTPNETTAGQIQIRATCLKWTLSMGPPGPVS